MFITRNRRKRRTPRSKRVVGLLTILVVGFLAGFARADDSFRSAKFLGKVDRTLSYNNAVGARDRDDFLIFTVPYSAHAHIELTNMVENADMVLYSAKGKVLASGQSKSRTRETLGAVHLQRDAYVLRIVGGQHLTTYTLKINLLNGGKTSARPKSSPNFTTRSTLGPSTVSRGDGNNSLSSAKSMGTVPSNIKRNFKGVMGSGDPVDYYSFRITSTNNVTVTLSGLNANGSLMLLTTSGSVLGRSNRSGTSSEQIARPLKAGTYILRVGVDSSLRTVRSIGYQVSIAARAYKVAAPAPRRNPTPNTNTRPAPAPKDQGANQAYLANYLSRFGSLIGSAGASVTDAVGSSDREDWYQFSVPSNRTYDTSRGVTITLVMAGGNADIEVYDQYGGNPMKRVAHSAQRGSTSERLVLNLGSRDPQTGARHTYYLKIRWTDGAPRYHLNVKISS